MASYLPLVVFWLVGLVWGTIFVFMKLASAYLSAEQIVLVRVATGLIPVLTFALVRRDICFSHVRYAGHFTVMAMLATVIYYLGFAYGTAILPSGIAGVLSGAIPLCAFVLSVVFLPEDKLTLRNSTGVACGLAGVVLIANPFAQGTGGHPVEGIMAMIAGSCCVGASFVYARRYITPLNIPAAALTTYQLGIGVLVLLAITPLGNIAGLVSDPWALWGTVLGLGVFGTGFAYIAYYYIVNTLGAVTAASATYIPPLVALIIGIVLLGEPISMLDIVAAVMILAGVVLLRKRP